MSKKDWKDRFLSSGLPLEASVASKLTGLGFHVPGELIYSRRTSVAESKTFSTDVVAHHIPYDGDLASRDVCIEFSFTVECKYRREGVEWEFIRYLGHDERLQGGRGWQGSRNLLMSFGESNRAAAEDIAIPIFPDGVPKCGAGTETIASGTKDNRSPITKAIQQALFGAALVAFERRLHWVNTNNISVVCPVVVTTAPLLVAREGMVLEGVLKAQGKEDVFQGENHLLYCTSQLPQLFDFVFDSLGGSRSWRFAEEIIPSRVLIVSYGDMERTLTSYWESIFNALKQRILSKPASESEPNQPHQSA